MIVGSICSGIEAASQAAPDNWEFAFFSEIEKFPSAVLAHHYPDVPNLGDFTKIKGKDWKNVNLLCGGPPCQSFSIAGKGAGLDDDRGKLTLDYVRLAHELADDGSLWWGLYENVPGILSDRTNAFGHLLSALVGGDDPLCPPDAIWGKNPDTGTTGWEQIRWPSQGMVEGPRARAAWDVLDAQFFGLAQRRKRLFVVISFTDDRDPAKILFERQGVRGNTPPSRKSGQGLAGNASEGFGANNEMPVIIDRAAFNQVRNALYDPKIEETESCPTIVARGPHAVGHRMLAFGEYADDQTASTIKARDHKDATDLVVFSSKNDGQDANEEIAPCLRAGSHDQSHANAGVPPAIAFKTSHYTRGKDGAPSEIAPPLTADADKGDQDPVILAPLFAFNSRQNPVSGEISGALDSHPTQAIAFAQNTRDEVRLPGGDGQIPGALSANERMKQRTYIAEPKEPYVMSVRGRGDKSNFEFRQDGTANCLLTPNGGRAGIGVGAVATDYAVRRLTPVECERLQGFPDDFTKISYRGKQADDCPDGPRYKALGNSWAVPVVKWIFDRIEAQEQELALLK